MIALKSRIFGFARRKLAQHCVRRPVGIRLSKAIISFSFDDFPHSALAVGGDILRRHGAAGTYYVSLGLMDTEQPTGKMFSREDLSLLLQAGHELGCHTYSHCDAWHTAPSRFEAAMVENRRTLDSWFPPAENRTISQEFKTFSYPINYPRPQNKRAAGWHFAGCRGGGQKINVGTADLNYLNAFFLEKSRDDFEVVRQIIARNQHERGWLIFATHDISPNPTRFGCSPAFFESVVSEAALCNAEILPVFRALQKIQ